MLMIDGPCREPLAATRTERSSHSRSDPERKKSHPIVQRSAKRAYLSRGARCWKRYRLEEESDICNFPVTVEVPIIIHRLKFFD